MVALLEPRLEELSAEVESDMSESDKSTALTNLMTFVTKPFVLAELPNVSFKILKSLYKALVPKAGRSITRLTKANAIAMHNDLKTLLANSPAAAYAQPPLVRPLGNVDGANAVGVGANSATASGPMSVVMDRLADLQRQLTALQTSAARPVEAATPLQPRARSESQSLAGLLAAIPAAGSGVGGGASVLSHLRLPLPLPSTPAVLAVRMRATLRIRTAC